MSGSLPSLDLSKADLRAFALSMGPRHREAINRAKHLLSLPRDGMLSAANDALSKLERKKLMSRDEVAAIRNILKLSESDSPREVLVKEVDAIARPILASKKSSPVALMLCSIAVDSIEHEPVTSPSKVVPRDKPGFGTWVADVIGGAVGGAAGGTAGFWGALALGGLVATIVSTTVAVA